VNMSSNMISVDISFICEDLALIFVRYTSRKHSKKEPQLLSHCDSFDHLDLQSLNECKIFIFYFLFFIGLTTEILRIWGLLIYR
jgi:hypothetical protein